ncbi:MAG TPA: hypothetical protein VGG82_07635 [Casimicrobiaceae bacterium]|jgi:hypothetical protein
MADEAKTSAAPREKTGAAKDKAAAGAAELREKAQEQGYFGDRPEQPDYDENPSAFDSLLAAKKAEIAAMEASVGGEA